jgi:hypothetical protein
MSRIMVCFGDLRSTQSDLLKALTVYLLEVIMKDEEWPQGFQNWSPDGVDWGYISWSDSQQATVPAKVRTLMEKYLFTHSTTPWGATRYDLKLDEMDDSVLEELHSRVVPGEKVVPQERVETEEKVETEEEDETEEHNIMRVVVHSYIRSVGGESPSEQLRILSELISKSSEAIDVVLAAWHSNPNTLNEEIRSYLLSVGAESPSEQYRVLLGIESRLREAPDRIFASLIRRTPRSEEEEGA